MQVSREGTKMNVRCLHIKSWSRLSAQDSVKAKWTAAGAGPLRYSRAGRAGGASRARRKFHAAAASGWRSK
jgi:hypothetical protein